MKTLDIRIEIDLQDEQFAEIIKTYDDNREKLIEAIVSEFTDYVGDTHKPTSNVKVFIYD